MKWYHVVSTPNVVWYVYKVMEALEDAKVCLPWHEAPPSVEEPSSSPDYFGGLHSFDEGPSVSPRYEWLLRIYKQFLNGWRNYAGGLDEKGVEILHKLGWELEEVPEGGYEWDASPSWAHPQRSLFVTFRIPSPPTDEDIIPLWRGIKRTQKNETWPRRWTVEPGGDLFFGSSFLLNGELKEKKGTHGHVIWKSGKVRGVTVLMEEGGKMVFHQRQKKRVWVYTIEPFKGRLILSSKKM